MQIKIFNIPIPGGEDQVKEMNAFLHSKRILQTESQVVNSGGGSFWSFCIKFLEDDKWPPAALFFQSKKNRGKILANLNSLQSDSKLAGFPSR